jgi:anthranilate phosphoribosyltransferase
VAELVRGQVREFTVHPRDFGLAQVASETLVVHGVDEAKARLLAALDGTDASARDIVALNAGAAIYAAGRAVTLEAGVSAAVDALASGAARARLDALITRTRAFTTLVPGAC